MSLEKLQAACPKVTIVGGGNVVTAAGVSSGLDMALGLVAELNGEDAVKMTAAIIEYPYPAKAGAK